MHTFTNQQQLEHIINEMGILPFFECGIKGFSIEEFCPPSLWFSDDTPGPWEWKGPMILNTMSAYGKLFGNKAAYVTMDFYPDLLNYRRSRCYLRPQELLIRRTVGEHGSLLTKELKRLTGYARKPATRRSPLERAAEASVSRKAAGRAATSQREGFDTAVTRLQMGCYLVVADFEYSYTRDGRRYGWGVARYATPEDYFGRDVATSCNGRTPQESFRRLLHHLRLLLPNEPDEKLAHFLG